MLGIVFPSIVLSMTAPPDHPIRPGPETIIPEPSTDEDGGLWLCIGDYADIIPKDPLIFRTSTLPVGDRGGDEQATGLPGRTPAYGHLNRRQSPARKESP
jgi:hypothetical protein